jgi:hypothetical protein
MKVNTKATGVTFAGMKEILDMGHRQVSLTIQ